MIIPLLAVLFFVGLNVVSAPPPVKTPEDLAAWAKCDPAKIAYGVAQLTEYRDDKGWLTSGEYLKRGWADCKGKAVIARDTAIVCGWKANILSLTDPTGGRHAIAVYTGKQGRRGFINNSQQADYSGDISWQEVVDGVSGGPWYMD